MGLTESQRQRRRQLRDDFAEYAPYALKIRTKAGNIEPFGLNAAQQLIHDRVEAQRTVKGYVRAILLKGRQQGASTYIEGRFYWRVTHRRGVRAYILTHEAEATKNLFDMARRYHDHCPAPLRPETGADSVNELQFSRLDSGYRVATAGNKGAGRSATAQYFHGSEVAFWPHAQEHAKGILQAIPLAPETEVILESTANGLGNYFHEQWLAAEAGLSDFIAIFVPWYLSPEYAVRADASFAPSPEESDLARMYGLTHDQLEWRRRKIRELTGHGQDGVAAFRQEYPCTPSEAFQASGEESLISPDVVLAARGKDVIRSGPLVLGVDPARGGDRTAMIMRHGRVAYGGETMDTMDTMAIVGRVVQIIRSTPKLRRVFIDVGGLGAGVYDRLIEMGYDIVHAVNFGASALLSDRYVNRRAEMWGEMSDWLRDAPVSIPDSDELHSDLVAPQRLPPDSLGRLRLEKKEDMRKRGLRSPDLGDALALTFAEPVSWQEDEAPMAQRNNMVAHADGDFDSLGGW